MIPRRFFWLFDILVLGIVFLTTYQLMPIMLDWLSPNGVPRWDWLTFFAPPVPWTGPFQPLAEFIWVFLVITPSTIFFLEVFGNYADLLKQSRVRILAGGFVAPILSLGLVTLGASALRATLWSRLYIFSFVLASGFCLSLYRLVLRIYYQRRQQTGYYARNVLVIGQPLGIAWVQNYFQDIELAKEYRFYGSLCLAGERQRLEKELDTASCFGEISDLGNLLIHHPIHEVIAVYPNDGRDWLQQVIQDCDYFRVLLRIVPEGLLIAEPHDLRLLYRSDPLNLPSITLVPPHLNSEALFVKRLIDIVTSTFLLLVLSPLLLLIAVAIKLGDPKSSVFYIWRVIGHNGVEFYGYKFRTMVSDADELKESLANQNEMSGPVFKIKNDPRITRLGRFLRKYSLDELPQLWSVLKGDMSLVGPRPAFPHELARYDLWHKRKLSIRPGITCLWQGRGRNRINNFDDWVRMDLEYIDNWSLWLDLKILVRTAWVVIAGTGS